LYRLLFAFFFFSGFTSLVFEVIWERMLMQVFGSTSLALSTLLTAFMTGLAIGAWFGGRYSSRLKRPLVVYGLLEAGVGIWALLVPTFLMLAERLYAQLFVHLSESLLTFSLARFVVIFLILVVPTTFMGASLPIVSQWIAKQGAYEGRVGWLYATNTFGAFAGTFAAGFVILPAFGLKNTNLAFACANVVLCLVIVWAARFMENDETQAPSSDAIDEIRGHRELIPLSPIARTAVAYCFLGAGLVAMTYQVLWTRAYVIVLGSSTYSFTMILACFLLATATGTWVTSALVHRLKRPVAWLALTQFLFALTALLAFQYLEDLPELLFHRFRADIKTPQEIWLYQFGLVGLLVFIPISLQGAAFPLVIRTLHAAKDVVGREVGRVYTFNTAGAIVGSFISGFLLLPNFGLRGALAFAVSLNLLVACVFFAVSIFQGRRHPVHIASMIVGITAVGALVFGPGMDRVKLTRGMFRTYWARELFDADKLAKDNPELVFYADGAMATISVEKRGKLVTLKSNGKPEASDGADMATQILVALAPFLVRSVHHPVGQERVAMIGYGSGVTAGAALQWPLKNMDVVEIEKEMIGASQFFNHVNHRPLEDKRTRVVESDGRNFLEFVPSQYDIIVSEPSNPWIAGVASLFTVEHFHRARRKLAKGGVFSQWVQLYEMNPENVRRIIATFTSAFPYVQAYSSMPKGTDLILVGSNEPIEFGPDSFDAAWKDPRIRAELQRAGLKSPEDFLGLMFMNQEELLEFAKGAELNTDDNGLLEFEAPKDLIRYDVGQQFFQDHYFSREDYGDPRPHLQKWPDGWNDEQVGALAMGAWRSGKPALAGMLLDDHHVKPLESMPPEPLSTIDKILLAQHAANLSLDDAVVHIWPFPGSSMHATAIDSVDGDKHLQALIWLERDGEPPRGGFEGEKGLFYAYVLTKKNYYRHALEQLEGLASSDDPMSHTAIFHLLSGFVNAKRRRYDASFEHYLKGSRLLMEAQ